jgi:hypothetical protein
VVQKANSTWTLYSEKISTSISMRHSVLQKNCVQEDFWRPGLKRLNATRVCQTGDLLVTSWSMCRPGRGGQGAMRAHKGPLRLSVVLAARLPHEKTDRPETVSSLAWQRSTIGVSNAVTWWSRANLKSTASEDDFRSRMEQVQILVRTNKLSIAWRSIYSQPNSHQDV